MSDEEAFLRAICEHPEEDTPRLAFADWLAEQGGAVNLAWANGIRAQVWQARGATDEMLAFQTCVFDSRFGQEKLGERLDLPETVVDAWERGFPSEAAGHFRNVHATWSRLAFRIPIRKLRIFEANEADAADFVTWPALSTLTELEFCGAWEMRTPPDVLPALANCESLRNLKSLTLRYALFSEATVTALLNAPHLTGLTVLRLDIDRATHALSWALKGRLVARFGEEVFDETIPF